MAGMPVLCLALQDSLLDYMQDRVWRRDGRGFRAEAVQSAVVQAVRGLILEVAEGAENVGQLAQRPIDQACLAARLHGFVKAVERAQLQDARIVRAQPAARKLQEHQQAADKALLDGVRGHFVRHMGLQL